MMKRVYYPTIDFLFLTNCMPYSKYFLKRIAPIESSENRFRDGVCGNIDISHCEGVNWPIQSNFIPANALQHQKPGKVGMNWNYNISLLELEFESSQRLKRFRLADSRTNQHDRVRNVHKWNGHGGIQFHIILNISYIYYQPLQFLLSFKLGFSAFMGSGLSVVRFQLAAKRQKNVRLRATMMCMTSFRVDAACMPLHWIYRYKREIN